LNGELTDVQQMTETLHQQLASECPPFLQKVQKGIIFEQRNGGPSVKQNNDRPDAPLCPTNSVAMKLLR